MHGGCANGFGVLRYAMHTGASLSDLMAGGKWRSFPNFLTYFKTGALYKDELLATGAEDPILKWWKWEPISFTLSDASL